MGEKGGDKSRNTNINFILGYQNKVGLDVVAQTLIPNVANFGVDYPIPGVTRMTTDSPINHFLGPAPLRAKISPHPIRTPTC